jgi:hypothetical protein
MDVLLVLLIQEQLAVHAELTILFHRQIATASAH